MKVRVRVFQLPHGQWRGYLLTLNNRRIRCIHPDETYDEALASANQLAKACGHEVVP